MRLLRPVLLAIVLAGGFFYFTTYRSGRAALTDWAGHPGQI